MADNIAIANIDVDHKTKPMQKGNQNVFNDTGCQCCLLTLYTLDLCQLSVMVIFAIFIPKSHLACRKGLNIIMGLSEN